MVEAQQQPSFAFALLCQPEPEPEPGRPGTFPKWGPPPSPPNPRHSDLQFSFFPVKTESPPGMGRGDCCNKSGSLHPSTRSCLTSMRWCSVALWNQMQMKYIPRYHLMSLERYGGLERGGDRGQRQRKRKG